MPRLIPVSAFALAFVTLATPALAQQFEFLPAPQTDLNRMYRIDRVTGEVGACQYALQEGSIGVTLCFPAGEGRASRRPRPIASSPRGTSGRAASSASICAPAR